ncbi:MAG: hypothetical protein EXS00_08965 [Phycisphaerales bacterium]|nr:hypothetical protein [Phycisphaerales bacterium]
MTDAPSLFKTAAALGLSATIACGSYARTDGQVLIDPDGAAGDLFSVSLASEGEWLMAGAMWDDTQAGPDQGSVVTFLKQGDQWIAQAKLEAPPGLESDYFGNTVAISNGVAVVGAYRATIDGVLQRGAAHVFTLQPSGWMHTQRLLASDGLEDDYFGSSVAIEGNTMVVASRLDDSGAVLDQGSAYVFERDENGLWVERQKLVAFDGRMHDQFGFHSAISGDDIFVGANWDDLPGKVDAGSVYRFHRDGSGQFQHAQHITAPDGQGHDEFGIRVVARGAYVVVGSPGASIGSDSFRGAAYVLRRGLDGVWGESQKLISPGGLPGDQLGSSLAIDGGLIAVGAWAADDSGRTDCGKVHIFRRDQSGLWIEAAVMVASATSPAGAEFAYLGTAIACNDGQLVAGAYSATIDLEFERGCAQVFLLPSGSDLTGDGAVDGSDLAMMLGVFGNTGATAADIDMDGLVGGADMAALMAIWGH